MGKIRDYSYPLTVGQNYAQRLWNYDIAALIWSSPHWKLKSGAWSGGGEFLQVRRTSRHSVQNISWMRNNVPWYGLAAGCGGLTTGASDLPGLSVGQVPNTGSMTSSFPTIDQVRNDLSNKADFTSGWNRTRPGNPGASLAQFIAELRDFPVLPGYQAGKNFVGRARSPKRGPGKPSFFRDWISSPVEQIPWRLQMQMGFFKSLGSEYLNHVFGWVPFVADLQKLYVLSQTIDNRIKQLARDSGRGVRRKVQMANSRSSSSATRTSAFGPFLGALAAPPGWADGGSSWTSTTVTERRSWFSARYRYYIPDVGSGGWIPKARRALYGGNITPSLVWELTPWSWLIDWFGNVGDVLSNFSENAVENLVADYAFCMINTKVTTTSTTSGSWKSKINDSDPTLINRIPGGSHNLTSKYTYEIKSRIMGSPYGLGVKFDSLSGKQLGILAALGISKSSF